jgi:hypothetical protein
VSFQEGHVKEISPKLMGKYKAKLKSMRNGHSGLMRFQAYESVSDNLGVSVYTEMTAACTGVISRRLDLWKNPEATLLMSFNGQSPENVGPAGFTSAKHTHVYVGGSASKLWLEFILDEENSPWRSIVKHVANRKDVDFINEEGGFVFTNLDEMWSSTIFSFLMATRFPGEQTSRVLLWEKLVNEGLDPKLAYLVVHAYNEHGGARNYPGHSFHTCPTKAVAKRFYNIDPVPDRLNSTLVATDNKLGGSIGSDKLWISPEDVAHYQRYERMRDYMFPSQPNLKAAIKLVADFVEAKVA